MVDAYSYLGWDSVKVLSQHPPHVFACVRGHLVLQQEGELATVSDAVEVAVDLVVLATCQKKKKTVPAVTSPSVGSFVFGSRSQLKRRRQHYRHEGVVIRSNPK